MVIQYVVCFLCWMINPIYKVKITEGTVFNLIPTLALLWKIGITSANTVMEWWNAVHFPCVRFGMQRSPLTTLFTGLKQIWEKFQWTILSCMVDLSRVVGRMSVNGCEMEAYRSPHVTNKLQKINEIKIFIIYQMYENPQITRCWDVRFVSSQYSYM